MQLNIWFTLILGHLLGDYVLQNKWMAETKKQKSFDGFLACFIHCIIYTSIVIITLSFSNQFISIYAAHANYRILFIVLFVLIFLSHYVIDRTHFVEWYANIMGIRVWNSDINLDNYDMESFTKLETIRLSFGTFVYIVLDNTLHLLLMTIILSFLL